MADLAFRTHDSIDAVNENQWNHVVEHSEHGSVFHRYEWLKAVEDGLSYEPRHVTVEKKGNPVAVFPNFVTAIDVPSVSSILESAPLSSVPNAVEDATAMLPALDDAPLTRVISATPGYGGPAITTNEEEVLELLMEGVDEICDGNVLNHTIKAKETEYMRYGKFLAKRGYQPKLTDCRFEIDLNYDWEEIESKMAKERRKALRKARETDTTVREVELTTEELRETYRQYRKNMTRVRGHVYPFEFFERLAEELPERTKVFAAEADGTDLGRYVYFLDDERDAVHYYFPAIGDDSNFDHYPSERLHEHVIRWAKERGYNYYDFGSTGSTFTDGVFRYKEKYGGRPIPTLQWEKGESPLLWGAYKLARGVYRKNAY
jgi:predicted N-acyltransferase